MPNSKKLLKIMLGTVIVVFFLSILSLIIGETLAVHVDVIGIRIAVLIVAFASFISSAFFSYLVYTHNKTVSKINDDTNRRGELFRELQFASSNYSIIEFTDRMLIYKESQRYVNKFLKDHMFGFHMIEKTEKKQEITEEHYDFYSIRIPFKVVEGKLTSGIKLHQIKFERDQKSYFFFPHNGHDEVQAYILYNEVSKRKNLIINLVVDKSNDFFNQDVNIFSKIKLYIKVTSLLGVNVKGVSELYFTNPTQTEGDGLHTYKINSSNFILTEKPTVNSLEIYEG